MTLPQQNIYRARSSSFQPTSTSTASNQINHRNPHQHHHRNKLEKSNQTESYSSNQLLQKQPNTIESLDLPPSLPFALLSLRQFLSTHLLQLEQGLESITNHLKNDSSSKSEQQQQPLSPFSFESSFESSTSSLSPIDSSEDYSSSDEADDQQPLLSNEKTNQRRPTTPTTPLLGFIDQLTAYIDQLKTDLLKTDSSTNLDSNLVQIPSSSSALKSQFDLMVESISDGDQLFQTLILHAEKTQEALSQLSLFSTSINGTISYVTDLSVLPNPFRFQFFPSGETSNDSNPQINLQSLKDYFKSESDRISSLLSTKSSLKNRLLAYKQEAQLVIQGGEDFIREEGERLKDWVDTETDRLRIALQMGASRLLTYQELPEEWKNNRYILSGYRFIPLDRWKELLLSGLQWHNETINIHTHLIGTMSLIYLLCFLWPTTPHTDPSSSTINDRLISFIFLICAIKCLVCSTAWHLFAGCGTLGPFRRLACVDYVGISGLIAASVASAEYYGFYCRPGLASLYIAFTTLMGIIGMILPFQPFFDRPESKYIRIIFFVSMACSALIPQAHMSYLYGFQETVEFYKPGMPSIFSYLAGLFFYATNWPERIKPGWVFDTLFHSHQFWHVAIVAAIWLHWRAIGVFHSIGRTGFSCAANL